MASLREYCEMLSTEQLKALLREECNGRGSLPMDTILMICDILSQRDTDLPGVRETLLNLCRSYLNEQL